MKAIVTVISLLFILACNEEPPAKNSSTVLIDKGNMPAIASDKKTAHLVYGFAERLMYAAFDDKGKSFSSPELVDIVPGLIASATRGPQIATTKNGVTIIAVNETGDIFSYLKDQSGKWIRTGRVNDTDSTDKEGFVGLSSDNRNNLFAIWTDLRGDRQNKIFGARSNDGGRTWMKNILVYASPSGTVCDCCKPSVVMDGKNVFVMFRNWLNGNRDLYLIESTNAGESFGQAQKLGKGSWALNACPMDGGGLAVNKKGIIETVWRRESKIYTCRPGTDEKEIGEGKGCTIESVNGKNIYAWTNNDDVTCLLPDGSTKILGKGSFPMLKSISNTEVICVWESEGDIKSSVIHI